MMKTLHFLALPIFALCALTFTSCSKDENKEAPVIGTYTIDGKPYDFRYAFFTQYGNEYLFGISNSNSINAGNKNWLGFSLTEAMLGYEIEFDGTSTTLPAIFIASIDGKGYIGKSNEPGDISGNMKITRKTGNTFNIAIYLLVDEKVVLCEAELRFTEIPFNEITGFLPE